MTQRGARKQEFSRRVFRITSVGQQEVCVCHRGHAQVLYVHVIGQRPVTSVGNVHAAASLLVVTRLPRRISVAKQSDQACAQGGR